MNSVITVVGRFVGDMAVTAIATVAGEYARGVARDRSQNIIKETKRGGKYAAKKIRDEKSRVYLKKLN